MSSQFGKLLKVSIFGESHGTGIGTVIDGIPPGEHIDINKLHLFLKRRAPGQSKNVTPRIEKDEPIFYSGIKNNLTTGAPISSMILNTDMRSNDYHFSDTPRPSHADYTAKIRYKGYADMNGSGHFSGRLTAPICIAGGIAIQILEKRNIHIASRLTSVGKLTINSVDPAKISVDDLNTILNAPFSIVSPTERTAVQNYLAEILATGNSVGGQIQTFIHNVPAGIGSPMFDGMENRFSTAFFGMPGVRGISFGTGFAACTMLGSEHNDPLCYHDHNEIATTTNHAGGIIGGITNGMPIIINTAMKPTASISTPQETICLSKKESMTIQIKGRHDPCIAIRALPVTEAIAALVMLDSLLIEGKFYELRPNS